MCTTVVRQWGNSQGILIPKSIMQLMQLALNDTLELNVENDRLTIRKTKNPVTLDSLFSDYHDDYYPQEYDYGLPVGLEV